jgi:hypothetical protein
MEAIPMWRHEPVSNRIAGPELILRNPALDLLRNGDTAVAGAPVTHADQACVPGTADAPMPDHAGPGVGCVGSATPTNLSCTVLVHHRAAQHSCAVDVLPAVTEKNFVVNLDIPKFVMHFTNTDRSSG